MDSVSYDISRPADFEARTEITSGEPARSAGRRAPSVAKNRRAVLGGIVAAMIAGLACADSAALGTPEPDYASPPHLLLEHAIYIEDGKGSWYGRWHHGRETASGERYNMYQMTAAHPTLPLGTVVRVTNLATGKKIKVRINDRGPYCQGRVIDLSAAAARALGITKKGTARVQIEAFASDQTPG